MSNKSLFFNGSVLFCLIFTCCNPEWGRKFSIDNNSNSSVYFAISYSYPDTTLKNIGRIPNQWQKLTAHEGKYESAGVFDLQATTLIFIFDAKIVESMPWDSIVAHYKVLKRYELTKSDMQKANWEITYP